MRKVLQCYQQVIFRQRIVYGFYHRNFDISWCQSGTVVHPVADHTDAGEVLTLPHALSSYSSLILLSTTQWLLASGHLNGSGCMRLRVDVWKRDRFHLHRTAQGSWAFRRGWACWRLSLGSEEGNPNRIHFICHDARAVCGVGIARPGKCRSCGDSDY